MTYAEAIRFLYDLRLFGAKFGLENTRKLANLAGDPQNRLQFIHVAGTNGKGSTCAMLESIYREAGLRVGLFTSPHLVSFRERIQVDRRLISEDEVIRLVSDIQKLLPRFPADHQPTFFEAITVMALRHFAEEKCDLVIWETGLGGRLDATNIVTPLASVITNIAYDHQQWLGDTLEKIAAEKAGIIKPGIPVITATTEPAALKVIERTAKENATPLVTIDQSSKFSLELSLPGTHQQTNANLTLATVEVLQDKIPVSPEAIRNGLKTVNWPGRLQLLTRSSGQKILLDGAHNIAGAQTLVDALRQLHPHAKPVLVLGILQDKDWESMCGILWPLAGKVLFVPVQSERTASPQALADACRRKYPATDIGVCSSLHDALESVTGALLVIIAGSLYLVGEALELLQPGLYNHSERALNEWSATPQTADDNKQP